MFKSLLQALREPAVFWVVVTAGGILAISQGIRLSLGLFVSPMNTGTGWGIATISLALALGQLVWGLMQPVAGAAADRWGTRVVLMAGLVIMASGAALAAMATQAWVMGLALGVLMAAGSGISSFSVLIGEATQKLSASTRHASSSLINAFGSLGQFIFAPVTQGLIYALGWVSAMATLSVLTLGGLPLIARLTRRRGVIPDTASGEPAAAVTSQATQTSIGLRAALRQAVRDPSFGLLNLGFFTCGFHTAFLVTHLPTEVSLCGLGPEVASGSLALIGISNVVGTLYLGSCMSRIRSKYLLSGMYASRALAVLLYMAAPKTTWTFYAFAVAVGFTWLATLPVTANVVTQLFGARYLATLFGLTLFSHQVGSFFGAWLGGVAVSAWGDYTWMFWADVALAVMATLVHLPIREGPTELRGLAT